MEVHIRRLFIFLVALCGFPVGSLLPSPASNAVTAPGEITPVFCSQSSYTPTASAPQTPLTLYLHPKYTFTLRSIAHGFVFLSYLLTSLILDKTKGEEHAERLHILTERAKLDSLNARIRMAGTEPGDST